MRGLTSAAVLLVFAIGASAQQTASSDPAFDVASVKPNNSGLSNSGSTSRPGGGYVGTNLTLHQLVTEAYRLRPFQVIGGSGSTRTPCGMNANIGNLSGMLKGIGQPLSRLANASSGFGVDGMVVDRTGLTGNFDIDLQWTPEILRSAAAGTAAGDGPSLFTAMQEQLGLKLESTRGPVEYLVIDSAEQLTPD